MLLCIKTYRTLLLLPKPLKMCFSDNPNAQGTIGTILFAPFIYSSESKSPSPLTGIKRLGADPESARCFPSIDHRHLVLFLHQSWIIFLGGRPVARKNIQQAAVSEMA